MKQLKDILLPVRLLEYVLTVLAPGGTVSGLVMIDAECIAEMISVARCPFFCFTMTNE